MRTLVAAVATLLTLALVADAQSSRRGREDPELVVENGYRTGACDDLRFTPDGKRLLAIGDDKVVRVWSFADGKIDPQSVRVLRWGIWREQRGAIYAMDISADGKRVVIGGLGAANSMVALLDLDSGEMLDSAVAPNDATGNVSAYWAAAFAPSGQRAVFGAGDGSVWLWDLEKHAFRRLGKPESNAPFNTVRLVRFEDESHVLSVSEDGSLLRWTLGRDDPDLVKKLGFTVFKAEISPDGKWLAAAAKGPLVTIRSLVDETEFRDIKLKGFETFHPGQKDGEYANALAFDPKSSRLAVAVGSFVPGSSFAIDGDDRIVFCDFSQKQAKETLSLEHSYKAERLTFHPSGGYFAAAGGDNQEVTLWDLAHTAEPATVLSGPARCLWDAALSVDGAVGFRDQRNPNSVNPDERARGPWRAFDPASRQWLAANDFKPVPRLTSLLGWTVQPAGNDPHVWYAVHESGARNKLTINGDLYGKPRCWTFLPPVNNGPVRLAVGHYWGFSVFELDPAAKEARRTRLCVGHQGEVTALGPSADGKQLVSCSTDMTLAFWDVTKSWPSQAILGAKFAPKDDRLVVTAADAGSPAWEAGLLVDDEIVQVGVGAGWVEGGPAAWLKQLEDPTPGAVYGFDVVRNGRNITAAGRQPLTTSLKQRPLWRFYPAGGDEWVLWMWRNNFYDSSTKGDYSVGWHVNSPDGKTTPHFYRAEQFRRYFRRRDVINSLLDTGDPAQALAVLGKNPVALHFDDMEPPAAELTVGPAQPGKDVRATLSAYARGDHVDEAPVDAEVWINDYRLPLAQSDMQQWPKDAKGVRTLQLTIPRDKLRGGDNIVTFQTWNRLGGRSDAKALIPGDHAAPSSPRLIGLVVGVNDYGSPRPGKIEKKGVLYNLDFAAGDAQDLSSTLKEQKLYASDEVTPLLDKAATRQAILDALDALAKKATPDDTCILFLSGHGDFREEKSTIPNGAPRSVLIFCPPGYDPARPYDTGISSELLDEKLAAVPCRKLLLLDACHSGAAAATTDSPARGFAPNGQGPIIIAACDRKQASLEHPKFSHGLFTRAILDALDDKAHYPDHHGAQELFATDLFRDVRQEMPKLLGLIGEAGGAQVPILFAPNNEDILVARDEAPKKTN